LCGHINPSGPPVGGTDAGSGVTGFRNSTTSWTDSSRINYLNYDDGLHAWARRDRAATDMSPQPSDSSDFAASLPTRPRSTAQEGGSLFTELCLAALPTGRVLNIGAGYTAKSRKRPWVVHLDLDPRVLEGCVLGAAGDAQRLPFRSGTFSGALLKDVLEHVPDPVEALCEVRRVCEPGAELIVTVPRAIPRAVWADPTHLRGFTARSLEWTMAMAGWTVVGRIDRIGSIPGAGRFPVLLRNAHRLLRVPGLGHRLGTNWLLTARRND
jgi:SAM-dependent methyltransferase